ncbi:MAG: extracellular solute-binding protein [Microbacterium sp.]|uniref:ABC transporter substrate-binding protein n=1 Tax=Microbacterium sp. TaxID=51671 RepID=UPI001AC43250|nr:extracellular solute-binding protein [Microbacterium sp.]MBN9155304.1 extracellular solute-binding protein [Microbacterium sp.]MBN9171273.1 extracellular solute-binding protein [Microbacterium sp.]
MISKNARFVAAAATGALAVLAVTACAPGGGNAAPSSGPTKVSDDVAAAGDVTLKLSDFWGSAEQDWIVSLIDQFEKKYPNVTIKRTQEDWGQLTSTLNLQMQDDGGPDIASANNGWSSLGTLAKGHLVLNLDAYADLYGWNEKVPTTIARQNKFTTDFKTIGEGSWFATPQARASLIGVYYNADVLKKLDITVPKTLADLEKAAAAVKAAGQVPFSYSGVDGNTAALLGLQALYGSEKDINDFVYGSRDVTAQDTGLTKAATTLQKWKSNGWLTPNFEGIDYQTSLADYLDGKGVFRFDYTGSLGLKGDQLNQFGYIQLPQASGDKTVGVGAAPGAMVISAKCKHPDVAAAFLNFLMSKQSSQTAADLGLVPALNDVATPDKLSQRGEAAATAKLDTDDGYVPYFDWSSPTMLDVLSQNTQLLLAGKTTPADFSKAVDADRTAFLAG